MKKGIVFLLAVIFISSCEVLQELSKFIPVSVAPTQAEIVQGLKKALELGINYGVSTLHKRNGYYNSVVKILLPKEVNTAFSYAINNKTVKSLGLDKVLKKKMNEVILSINRAAEEAVSDAKPIFISALNKMTITQGLNILQGHDPRGRVHGFDSLAATHYFELKTRAQLFSLFKPKIQKALDKDLGLGFSANQAWTNTIKYYNNYVATVIGKPKINYTLTEYATNKALDGLFYMIGKQEKSIRRNPYKWSYDIIKKVFGYVYKPH